MSEILIRTNILNEITARLEYQNKIKVIPDTDIENLGLQKHNINQIKVRLKDAEV